MNNTGSEEIFNFTLGPVQGFVAQARRTRDFWAGSFLLSWLAGIAMYEVEQQHGVIIFPIMDEDYKKAIGGEKMVNYPQQGGVPNRFKARVPNNNFDPEKVIQAVQTAWCALAKQIWENDIKNIAESFESRNRTNKPKTEKTKIERLWLQQVDSFWEMNWIINNNANDNSLVDRRKNWRIHFPPPQSGGKCSLMAGWQELSATWTSDERKQFWQHLQTKTGNLDLGDEEYLCAIAFIKRRFHKYFESIDEPMPSNWSAHGWKIAKTAQSVPSVTYIAAALWLAKVLQESEIDVLNNLAACGEQLAGYGGQGERHSKLKCIQDVLDQKTTIPASLSALDGAVFFPDLYGSHYKQANEAKKNKMHKTIKALNAGQPDPFYAVLLMDGDSLGKLLSGNNREAGVTAALNDFCRKVPEVVNHLNGFLIYAGGDDVLALLPLDTALECAQKIREQYQLSFEQQIKDDSPDDLKQAFKNATISAAIQYVHVHCPLTRILHAAHALLDDVAKDGCGRDALAVRVVKTGGMALEWAQPWDIALSDKKSIIVNDLAKRLVPEDAQQRLFSSKFLYSLRDLFKRLNEVDALTPEEMEKLVLSAYQSSGLCPIDDGELFTHQRIEHAKSDLKVLLTQCQPHKRTDGIAQQSNEKSTVDAALLIRFLASKGLNI